MHKVIVLYAQFRLYKPRDCFIYYLILQLLCSYEINPIGKRLGDNIRHFSLGGTNIVSYKTREV